MNQTESLRGKRLVSLETYLTTNGPFDREYLYGHQKLQRFSHAGKTIIREYETDMTSFQFYVCCCDKVVCMGSHSEGRVRNRFVSASVSACSELSIVVYFDTGEGSEATAFFQLSVTQAYLR